MENISIIGIDIAKHSFSVCCGSASGRVIKRKRLYREGVLDFFRNQTPCIIGMEACAGSHYWGRELQKMGHTVKLMPPQYVKPYVKTNKNDDKDAEACFEAVTRPTMRFVEVKTERQQELGQIHRVRERLIAERTALCNEARGFLHEFGIVMPKGAKTLRRQVTKALEEHEEKLLPLTKEIINRMMDELKRLEEEVEFYEGKIKEIHKSLPDSQTLDTIGGIGVITSTAIIATVSNMNQFKCGRQFSAFIGLTPKQRTTGGKTQLGRISKHGDGYIRKLLVQGAHAELRHVKDKTDRRSMWLKGLVERRGIRKAAVALANKNARIAWALLSRGGKYDPEHAPRTEKKAA
jgi:transposase